MTNEQIEALKREVTEAISGGNENSFEHKFIGHIIDHLHSQKRLLADGCVGVPMEPTKEMIWAGTENTDEFVNGDPWYGNEPLSDEQAEQCYKAMITAAQTEKREGE